MRSSSTRSGEQLRCARCTAGFAGVGFCRCRQGRAGEQARAAVSSCGVLVVQHLQGERKAEL